MITCSMDSYLVPFPLATRPPCSFSSFFGGVGGGGVGLMPLFGSDSKEMTGNEWEREMGARLSNDQGQT